jgi:hypothetical protein
MIAYLQNPHVLFLFSNMKNFGMGAIAASDVAWR